MSMDDLWAQARDTISVKRVFGDPYEKDGVTLIPAAVIIGGLGGGAGHSLAASSRSDAHEVGLPKSRTTIHPACSPPLILPGTGLDIL